MAEQVHVTPSQADAARLIVERDSANGKPTSEAIRKIATAQEEPVPETTSRPGPRAAAGAGGKWHVRALLTRLPGRRAASGEQ